MKNITIIDFKEELTSDFVNINMEWISSSFYKKNFAVEDYDRKVLSDPVKYIIAKKGHILFAKIDEKIVGTVALVSRENNAYELSKLAVLQNYRGLKIGDALLESAIKYSKDKGKNTLWLESIKKLKPALSLFKKFGFKEIPLDSNSPYAKADIKMSLQMKEK